MKKNMGTIDRSIRTILAIVVAVLYLTGNISGITAIVLGVIAIILLITSLIGFCSLYTVLGISTNKEKEGK